MHLKNEKLDIHFLELSSLILQNCKYSFLNEIYKFHRFQLGRLFLFVCHDEPAARLHGLSMDRTPYYGIYSSVP